MTNTDKLMDKIKKSGKKISFLAERVGLSRSGFRNCIINKATFKATHIDILCDELKITSLKEKEEIFFAKYGA